MNSCNDENEGLNAERDRRKRKRINTNEMYEMGLFFVGFLKSIFWISLPLRDHFQIFYFCVFVHSVENSEKEQKLFSEFGSNNALISNSIWGTIVIIICLQIRRCETGWNISKAVCLLRKFLHKTKYVFLFSDCLTTCEKSRWRFIRSMHLQN